MGSVCLISRICVMPTAFIKHLRPSGALDASQYPQHRQVRIELVATGQ